MRISGLGTAWYGGASDDVEAEAVLVGGATGMGEMVRMEPCGRHKSPEGQRHGECSRWPHEEETFHPKVNQM